MELDELKKQLNQQITTRQHSTSDIAALLSKDRVSVVQKIKGSLWLELAISIVFTIGCAFAIACSTIWVYKTYFSIFIFTGIAFIVVLSLLIKKINKLSSSDTVRSNLESLVSVLKEYVKRYLQFGMALVPVCFAFAYWLSYHDPTKVGKPFTWDVFGYLVAYLLILGTSIYYFCKWYLKKLYGNYINQLEELLKEINEEA